MTISFQTLISKCIFAKYSQLTRPSRLCEFISLSSMNLFDLDTKPELFLNLLVGHLHVLVLVRPALLVHLHHVVVILSA